MTHAVSPTLWTDPRIELLTTLHALKEMSFSQIAREINEQTGSQFSRNAIIGKANRMGLYGQPRIKRTYIRSYTRGPYKKANTAPAVEIEPLGLTFAELNLDNQCHYPVTEDTPFLFCGHPTAGQSYCAFHHQICWVAPGRRA